MMNMDEIKVFKEPVELLKKTRPIEYIENENECFILINRHFNRCGYGRIVRNNRNLLIHRYIYECVNGEIPKNMVIMHTCDTPACINPMHLKLGTQQENIQDMRNKNRHHFGERSSKAKLNEKQVIEILDSLEKGVTSKELSKKFNLASSSISYIKRGINWKHITRH